MIGPLVSVEWLRDALDAPGGAPEELRIVDCRYRLGEPGAGERLWRESHIPGAAFLDLDRDLAGPPGERGRHPLPEQAGFEAAARRAGISPETTVIAYDEAAEGGAARLWWLLRHFGHTGVAVLDGGLRGWREAGGPTTAAENGPGTDDVLTDRVIEKPAVFRPVSLSPGAGRDDTATLEELTAAAAAAAGAGAASSPLLLDARAPERYRGETEPIDSVAGHIPGAHNLPFAELAPGGRFLSPEELRARFEAAGALSGADLVGYCGSGVTACVLVLAAEVAGLGPARLYPGSWSEWSGRGLPVERGPSAARH
jgi:thiosulfate/3-mercaptopyruvate sulfurtransferase